jgi:hypothetical protein
MPTDEESGDSYRNTKVGDLRLDELLEISIPHANGFAVGSAIEEDRLTSVACTRELSLSASAFKLMS